MLISLPHFNEEFNISDFRKREMIGENRFSYVYEVENTKTGQLYAAKIINCQNDENRCNDIISKEVNIFLKTNCRTIVKYFSFSRTDFDGQNNVTVLMELFQNRSLEKVITNFLNNQTPENFTNTTKQIIMIGIASAMKFLHRKNIIHRNLKAKNVLLDQNFHPKISDFGLLTNLSKSGAGIRYEAPELFKNEPQNFKTDVYAFGILLFEIVSNSLAFPELENNQISDFDFKTKILNDNYRPKFNGISINESLQKLIEKCWSENPNDRPSFDEIFDNLTTKSEFLLDDVDENEFKFYIEEISDSNDEEIEKLKKIIEDLKSQNEKILTENNELKDKNKSLENEINQIKKIANIGDKIKQIKNNSENQNQNETVKVNSNQEQNKTKIINDLNIKTKPGVDENSVGVKVKLNNLQKPAFSIPKITLDIVPGVKGTVGVTNLNLPIREKPKRTLSYSSQQITKIQNDSGFNTSPLSKEEPTIRPAFNYSQSPPPSFNYSSPLNAKIQNNNGLNSENVGATNSTITPSFNNSPISNINKENNNGLNSENVGATNSTITPSFNYSPISNTNKENNNGLNSENVGATNSTITPSFNYSPIPSANKENNNGFGSENAYATNINSPIRKNLAISLTFNYSSPSSTNVANSIGSTNSTTMPSFNFSSPINTKIQNNGSFNINTPKNENSTKTPSFSFSLPQNANIKNANEFDSTKVISTNTNERKTTFDFSNNVSVQNSQEIPKFQTEAINLKEVPKSSFSTQLIPTLTREHRPGTRRRSSIRIENPHSILMLKNPTENQGKNGENQGKNAENKTDAKDNEAEYEYTYEYEYDEDETQMQEERKKIEQIEKQMEGNLPYCFHVIVLHYWKPMIKPPKFAPDKEFPCQVFPIFATMLQTKILLNESQANLEKCLQVISADITKMPATLSDIFLTILLIFFLIRTQTIKYKLDQRRCEIALKTFLNLFESSILQILEKSLDKAEVYVELFSEGNFDQQKLLDDFKEIFDANKSSFMFGSVINNFLITRFTELLEGKMLNRIIAKPDKFTFGNAANWNFFLTALEKENNIEMKIIHQAVNSFIMVESIAKNPSLSSEVCPDISPSLISFFMTHLKSDENIQVLPKPTKFNKEYKLNKAPKSYDYVPIKKTVLSINTVLQHFYIDNWNNLGPEEPNVKYFSFFNKYIKINEK